jgi:hypothetical protein
MMNLQKLHTKQLLKLLEEIRETGECYSTDSNFTEIEIKDELNKREHILSKGENKILRKLITKFKINKENGKILLQLLLNGHTEGYCIDKTLTLCEVGDFVNINCLFYHECLQKRIKEINLENVVFDDGDKVNKNKFKNCCMKVVKVK